jgi:nucleoside-diphosphate-sugar epimerase
MRADWLYSRDAGAGLASLLRSGTLRHELYNLGGGTITDLPDWCAALNAAGLALRWQIASEGQPSDIRYNLPQDRAALAIARIKADTGFQPRGDSTAFAADYLNWSSGLSL